MFVEQFLCRSDNIGLLCHNKTDNTAIAIDAPDGEAILKILQKTGSHLQAVLITHHHTDHTEGFGLLKQNTKAKIFGPKQEVAKIGILDKALEDKEEFSIGRFHFITMATPGHTLGEICYYLPKEEIVFTGDTLFSLGCGRIFEGNPAMMFASLQKLATLPPQTKIYCGHEYSTENSRFADKVEPKNQDLQKRIKEIHALRAQGRLTLPSTIGAELAENPFLRCDSAEIRQNLHYSADAPAVEIFAKLRQMKDNF